MSFREPAPSRSFILALLLLPAAAALLYAGYTGQIWEDYFITIRHTENLVNGHGLVYQPGERVHGFTSVLNTLVPALPMKVTGSFGFSLNFYRACSLLALLGGLWSLWRTQAARLGATRIELALAAVLAAVSVKIIAFTMNGQETGFLVGFLALGTAAALEAAGPGAWRKMGLAWAGLLYTRPDSPFYIILLAGLGWWMRGVPTGEYLRTVVRAGLLAAVVFLPWFAGSWIYYGSPVPHTVVAKAADSVFVGGSSLATFIAISSALAEMAGDAFGGIYGLGGWPEWIGWSCVLGGLAAAAVWAVPAADRFARGLSLALLATLVYLAWLRVQREAYPWYFGPAALFAIVVWARVAATSLGRPGRARRAIPVAAALLVLASGTCFALSLRHQKIHQAEVEENTRKAIGLWLKGEVGAGDTVYLEPIGYIGYFSQARILDYPGLVSREVVAARRREKADFTTLPVVLKPTWIVARRAEIEQLKSPALVAAYDWKKEFNNLEDVARKYGRFAGELTVQHDLWYVVLKRKPGM